MTGAKGIWVFIESERDEIRKVSLETLCEARKLANGLNEELCALLLGDKVESLAELPPHYGADRVFLMQHESLSYHNVDAHLNVVANLVKENSPRILLFGSTPLAKELAPRLAAQLRVGLVTDAADVKIDASGKLVVRKPVYGGKAHATFACAPATPQMASVAPGFMDVKPPDASRKGEVVKLALVAGGKTNVEFIEFIKGDPRTVAITEAEMIVAVGRGLEKKENLSLIEELADKLGASIGGSRVAVDNGWVPAERQVGMTGKTVAPRLYIACGISGQYPHTVGMERSGTVMVINTDRNAPMFKLADIGVLGDVSQVVPAISKRLSEVIAPPKEKAQ
ncbi:MAG: electron transfer flavoprotein subunit alpha/FixB family protein [Chloroflexi bacterium]|nr:electron transfer flavoprotein subunit alpha/FixB family protein [Chloroflexota bacterium]